MRLRLFIPWMTVLLVPTGAWAQFCPPITVVAGGAGGPCGGGPGGSGPGSATKAPASNSRGSLLIGDPFSIADGASYVWVEDARLQTAAGPLSFYRSYVSSDLGWTYYNATIGAPLPFGGSPTDENLPRWWHNFFSLVDKTGTLVERTGRQLRFTLCTLAPGQSSCFATPEFGSQAVRGRLERTRTGFVYHSEQGERLVYEAAWVSTWSIFSPQYFLSRIETVAGQVLATLEYEQPAGLTCPTGLAGTTPGAPYLKSVTTAEGAQLAFGYKLLRRTSGKSECVLKDLTLRRPGLGEELLATYTYRLEGGTLERPGLLGAVAWAGRTESYDYTSGAFTVTRNGQVVLRHEYGNTSPFRVVRSEAAGGESVEVSWAGNVSCQPGSNCCGYEPQRRTASFLSAGAGDGSTTSAGLSRVYDILAATPAYHEPRLYRTEDRCTVAQACSPGSMLYEWACNTANLPGYERAVKDKRGNWTVNLRSPAPAGKPRALSELTAVLKGATDANGTGALERTEYSYQYGQQDSQLVSTEQRASLLAPQGSPEPFARVRYIREPPSTAAPRTDALKAVLRSGWTRVWTGSAWSLRKRFIATFYLPTRTGESTTDPLGRALEVQGPCEVDSEAATQCQPGPRPVRQYHYYPASAPAHLRHRLEREVLYPNGDLLESSNPVRLTTRYLDYDSYGNTTRIEDANGVLTQLGYSAGQLVSWQVGSQPPTTLGYEGDKVHFVRQPAGNLEVFCYRQDTPGEACVGGTLTNKLQWKARAGTEDGSDWTEKVVYAWWPDGILKAERYLSKQGIRVETRRVLRYAADAHQRPTWQAWGEGAGAFVATRSFDGADNLTGAGHAYNAPPAWCDVEPASGRPRSPLCAALSYDRANRLVSLDEFPAPDAAAQRTLLEYDTHGNVRGVKTGCSSMDTFATCTQPASWYTIDDFGQVLEAQLPWTEGPVRYSYNAQGHPVVKETEAMRRAGERLTYTYDSLSRLVSARWEYSRPAPGSQGLYRFQYDTSSETPGPGCPLPARTLGRLLYREDSFGRTWYPYDEAGSVAGEIRERRGSNGCNNTAYHSPHTFYTSTPNGQTASLLYPYGRRVDYVYGTGADADRVVAVDVALRQASGWVTKRLLSHIVWEPYGGLRGYTLHHPESDTTSTVEYGLGSNGQVAPSGCGPVFPSSNPVDTSDLTGRLRSLRVSSGTVPPGTGSGDLYQRNYTWQADQVVRTDTCLLGSTTPQTETFTYDTVLRLTQATGGLTTTGGAFGSRVYGYSPRGHRTSEQGDSLRWNLAYTPGPRPDWLSRRAAPQGLLGYGYTADADGRTLRKLWPPLSTGAPAFTLDFTPGPSAGGAAETAFQSLRVNGALYEYRYDAWQRRWLKQYPSGVKDEFFYNLGHELLVDQGNASMSPATTHPVDEYVWLAGRPVVMLRGKLGANWEHLPDSPPDCVRNGEPARCGVYFPITDPIGKPVLMLDSQRRIAGVGEYDPFGHVNRVSVQAETPHPYHSFSDRFGPVLRQPVVPGTVLQQRVLVDALELYGDWMDCTSNSNDSSDAVYLRDVNTQAPLTTRYTANSASGNFWTEWFTPGAGGAEAVLENIGSCSQQAECNDLYCQPGACVCGVSRPKSQVGAAISAYEYRRFQPGASPLWTPLRFPGQYHDAESNLVHNWHRTYDPATGRYLQPEPLAATGTRMATGKPYAYASHNPLRFQDPTGLYDTTELGQCPNWAPALAIARRRAGCGPEGSGKSDSSCNCQKKLAACSVCDICKTIDPGVGPLALQMDWRDEPSRGGRMGLTCEPWDLKCPTSRITKWRAFFATELCVDPKHINDLAGTIIHEATHSCLMFGGKKVPDVGSEECTAYIIEETCK